MSKLKKIDGKFVLKYLVLFFLLLVLGEAEVKGLNPFLFAFFFACLYVGAEEKLCAIFTLAASMLSELSLENFLTTITVIGVGLVIFYLMRLLKKKMYLWTTFCGFLLSLVTKIYYSWSDLINAVYFVLLGLICLYCFIVVMQIFALKKNYFKLTLDESICLLFMIAVMGLGISDVYLWKFSLFRFVIMLVIFFMLALGNSSITSSVAISFAIGAALHDFSLVSVAEFACITLLANLFPQNQKFKTVFAVLIIDVLIQYVFFCRDLTFIYALAPIVLAGVIYLIVPKKVINRLSDVVYVKKSELSTRNLINQTRKSVKKRMSELSNIFLDMKQIHLNMIKKELTKEQLVAMLEREVMATCCKDCLDKNRCTRSLGTLNKSNLEMLIEIAVTKGKVTLLDIPSSLTNRCAKVNNLITLINRLRDEYKQYRSMMADVNNVKILLADQMGAVSNLLLDIGDEIDKNVSFDQASENKIISRLLNLNIECKEVLIYAEKGEDCSVGLIVRGGAEIYPVLERAVSECLHMSMQVDKATPIENEFLSVTLKKKSKYDCVFGLASCNKSGNVECGDCHSIIRLNKDRFLLALCDGMGSGSSAHMMSAMTLGLIENFYKVGFDNDVVLESVNKLLSVNNQETYSTLDVCLLDLNKGIGDFIKVGSPFGLIKRDSETEVVEGGALPIGALENITPVIKKYAVTTKDIVILFTDGITDAFVSTDNVIEYVSKLATNNPQSIAESILNEALRLNEMQAKDDMTVLVARTYLKSEK